MAHDLSFILCSRSKICRVRDWALRAMTRRFQCMMALSALIGRRVTLLPFFSSTMTTSGWAASLLTSRMQMYESDSSVCKARSGFGIQWRQGQSWSTHAGVEVDGLRVHSDVGELHPLLEPDGQRRHGAEIPSAMSEMTSARRNCLLAQRINASTGGVAVELVVTGSRRYQI